MHAKELSRVLTLLMCTLLVLAVFYQREFRQPQQPQEQSTRGKRSVSR